MIMKRRYVGSVVSNSCLVAGLLVTFGCGTEFTPPPEAEELARILSADGVLLALGAEDDSILSFSRIKGAGISPDGRLIASSPAFYEVFPLQCPDCGADMRILAFLTEPGPVQAILRHLGLPAAPPPLSPARGPPQPDLGFDREPDLALDQTPAFDPAEPEPVPDFDDADPDRGA